MAFWSAPTCTSCVRRLTGGLSQQIRGKKKLAKCPTITVKLLQDIAKYGRKGIIIPVARGRMRSVWYPRGMAEYMTASALKKIPAGEVVTERDLNFEPDVQSKKRVEIDLLSPAQSISTLEGFLPPILQFSRATISPTDDAIHGSITTADIATAIRAVAAASGSEVSRVVINAENVEFVDKNIEEKLRAIGEYEFEIKMKGTDECVRRKVVIVRQDEEYE